MVHGMHPTWLLGLAALLAVLDLMLPLRTVCKGHSMLNTSTHYPTIFALLTLLISTSTVKAEEAAVDTEGTVTGHIPERSKAQFSSSPGYTIFPTPHIQPGIGEGVGLIGSTMNIKGTTTNAYAILFRGQVKDLTIGIADLHLIPKTPNANASDTLYGNVGWYGERGMGYQALISYRGVGSEENPFLAAKTYTLGIAANEVKEEGGDLSYGYTLTVHQNTERQGNDYAYVGHAVNSMVDKTLGERWSGYLSGSVNLFLYSNPDSFSQFQKRRVNLSLGLGGGVSYHYSAGLSLFAGCDFYIQRSNLPRGFIYNQLQIIEGIQGTSLGSYTSSSINVGVRYNF